jgi:hypothetical protein
LKIRLDENLSFRIANALIAYMANRDGFEVSHNTFVAQGHKDPAWLIKFASDDGDMIISGDWKILQHWPDLVAFTESGLVSFFPPPQFGQMIGYARAAFILRWWPAMIEKYKVSARGDRWRLPPHWTPDQTKITALQDPRLKTDDQKRERKIQPIGKVHQFRG